MCAGGKGIGEDGGVIQTGFNAYPNPDDIGVRIETPPPGRTDEHSHGEASANNFSGIKRIGLDDGQLARRARVCSDKCPKEVAGYHDPVNQKCIAGRPQPDPVETFSHADQSTPPDVDIIFGKDIDARCVASCTIENITLPLVEAGMLSALDGVGAHVHMPAGHGVEVSAGIFNGSPTFGFSITF